MRGGWQGRLSELRELISPPELLFGVKSVNSEERTYTILQIMPTQRHEEVVLLRNSRASGTDCNTLGHIQHQLRLDAPKKVELYLFLRSKPASQQYALMALALALPFLPYNPRSNLYRPQICQTQTNRPLSATLPSTGSHTSLSRLSGVPSKNPYKSHGLPLTELASATPNHYLYEIHSKRRHQPVLVRISEPPSHASVII